MATKKVVQSKVAKKSVASKKETKSVSTPKLKTTRILTAFGWKRMQKTALSTKKR